MAAWIARVACAALLLVAAASKIADPIPVARVVGVLGLPLIGDAVIPTVGAVTGLEVFLALGMLVLPGSRWILLAFLLTITAFTVVLLRLLWIENAPGCACLGFLFASGDPVQQTTAGVVRNIGLTLVGLWLLAHLSRTRLHASTTPPASSAPSRATSRPAFTIVEVMVSISVIAVLVAILLPTLSRTRAQAHITRALSSLRQVHAATALYAGDNGDALPYIATPQRPWETIYARGIPIHGLAYFRQGGFVLSVVAPDYHDNPADLRFTDPQQEFPPGIIASRYVMTCTAFAAPAYWRGQSPPDDLRLFAGARSADIAFPSAKGLWLDYEMSLLPTLAVRRGEYGPWVIARADGSARTERFDPSYQQPFIRSYGAAPIPGMMTTVDGLAGRDF